MVPTTDAAPAPIPQSGGSAASQAMRAELAKQDLTPEATSSPAPKAASLPDVRAAARKKVSGRANIGFANGQPSLIGKMMDVSLTGACVMLDQMVPPKSVCTLECSIFQEGKRFVFRCQAVTVYGVLVGGQGFKIGVVFGPMDASTAETVKALVA